MIESMAKFFGQGGVFMWLILGILAAALAVIVERLMFYFGTCKGSGAVLVAETAAALNENDTDRALNTVSAGRSPLHAILTTAVERYRQEFPYDAIKKGVEEAAIKEVPRLSQRLNYLAMFANVATLAGLLGTIFGLQKSFSSLGLAEAAQKATMLASGISQAMNTTAFGLMVAIPCMIAYSILSNKQTRLTEDLDEAAVKMLHYLEQKSQTDER